MTSFNFDNAIVSRKPTIRSMASPIWLFGVEAPAVRPIRLGPVASQPDEVVASFEEAVADIPDGATLMVDGFAGPGGTSQNLIRALRDHGAEVTTVGAYRTVLGQGGADVPGLLAGEEIDAITFSSPTTVRNFLTRLENEGGSRRHLDGVCLAAIGPITAATMASLDLPVTLNPGEFTLPSLVSALDAYFRSETTESE